MTQQNETLHYIILILYSLIGQEHSKNHKLRKKTASGPWVYSIYVQNNVASTQLNN